ERPPSAAELDRLGDSIKRRIDGEAPPLGPVEVGLRFAGSVPESVVAALREADRSVGPFGPRSMRHLWPAHRLEGLLDPLPVLPRASFDRSELKQILDGRHGAIKRRVRQLLSAEEFRLRPGLPMGEYRELVTRWLGVLADEGIGALGYPSEAGGGGDPGGFLAALATIAHHDLSLMTKFGVQFGLYAGSLFRLGSDRHRDLLRRAISGSEPGCFAMTETGHGSDVSSIQTTATFDDGDWVIDTPDPAARKDYIGNAAVDGKRAVVFARLITDGTDHGVHA